jgi:chaperone BCS1
VLVKEKRSPDSVVLDNDVSSNLLGDARHFLSSHAWYTERGIPYRRGYLLHGPPGSGKTSFVQVLAGELSLDICMLSLSNESLTDESLASNLRDAPANSIILLEDVDAVFVASRGQGGDGGGGGSGGDRKRSSSNGVSFSGLLNAIDGVASQEGRMFFMTTNYPDRLDAALVRPGRCDVKVELNYASQHQVREVRVRCVVVLVLVLVAASVVVVVLLLLVVVLVVVAVVAVAIAVAVV